MDTYRLLIVGARSARQGTGPFIAAGLARAGADIAGIVGTSDASIASALNALTKDCHIHSRGFTDLSLAIKEVQPNAVAICSPWRFHAEQLRAVAEAGCHCLVEKPMAWPASAEQVHELVALFESRGLLLQLVGQWPTTLSAFSSLHGPLPASVKQFRMRLSPISVGQDMITDSAPHFVSMLQALAGPGECKACSVKIEPGGDAMELGCLYENADHSIDARLLLETCETRPRPAWYEINGLRADRKAVLPQYDQYLVSNDRQVALEDPMHLVAAQFLAALAAGAPTEAEILRSAHRNLLQLASAWR